MVTDSIESGFGDVLAHHQGGIDRGVAIAAGRIGFDRGLHQLPRGAEVLQGTLGRRVGGVGTHETMRPFEGLGGALEALAHQGGGNQAVAGGPADLGALGPGAVDQELQAAGALAEHGAEGAFDAGRIEAEHTRGRGRGAECAAGGGGVEAAVVMRLGGQREGDAAGDLISGDDGGKDIGARCRDHLAGGQRGGDDRRAGMQAGGGVGVIEVERVGQGAVEEGGAGGAVAVVVAEDAAGADSHAGGADHAEEGRGALGVMAGADDVADEVEQQEAGAGDDLGRQGGEGEVGGKSG